MKKHMRLVAFLIVSAFLFVSCGASTNSGGNTAAEPSEGTKTITVMDWNPTQEEIWNEVIDQFEATHEGVEVVYDIIPFEQYWTKLESSIASGSGPDILCMNPINSERFSKNGALLPLNDYIERDKFDMSVFADVYTQYWALDGIYYALPKDIDGFAIFYNKRIFDEAGVPYPEAGWTWKDFQEKAWALTDPEKKIYGWVFDPHDGKGGIYNTIFGFDGYVLSEDKKTCGYDDPNTIEAIQFVYDTLNKKPGVSPTIQQLTEVNAADTFMSGRGAMQIQGTFRLLDYINNENVGSDLGIAPMPVGSSEKMVANGVSWAINSATKEPDLAWELLSMLCGDVGAEAQARSGIIVPANENYHELYSQSSPKSVDTTVFLERLDQGVFQPVTTNLNDWRAVENGYFDKIFNNEMEVTEACLALTEEMNQILAQQE